MREQRRHNVVRLNPERTTPRERQRGRGERDPARRDGGSRRERHDRAPESPEEIMASLGIRSFSQEYRRLLRQVDADADFSSAQAAQSLVRAQLSAAINAMPAVERSVQKYGGKAVYAMVALGDHIRALTHDLKGFGDQSALANKIRRDCAQPALGELGTAIISEMTTLRADLHEGLGRKEAAFVDRRMRTLQERLAPLFKHAEERLNERTERTLSS